MGVGTAGGRMSGYATGMRIGARDEVWVVSEAERIGPDGWRLTVTGVSPLVREQRAVFFTGLEGGPNGDGDGAVTALRPEDTELVADDTPGFRRSRLYWESVLRATPLPQAQRSLATVGTHLVDDLPYQREPARVALAGLRPRILIADAVGLGKTLEIGLLLSELIRRGRGERILVVTPRHILEQFQHELWTRFAIPLVRLDSEGIARVRRRIPAGRNPFTYYKRAIISIDTLKSSQYRHALKSNDWDAVVIDESHKLVNVGAKNNELARVLAPNTHALILASATPHNGRKESFGELISLLDPTAIPDTTGYGPEAIAGLYVRRHKTSPDVEAAIGDQWMQREAPRFVYAKASAAEEAVFEELYGTWISPVDGVPVRVIEATIAVTCADGSVHRGRYRLITTLTDARRHPAAELLALYHDRWEIEVAFLALRHTMLRGRVLRSGDPQGLRQEMWALLAVYQVLRAAMADATDAIHGCDPDRACFTAALEAARDSVTTATEIMPDQGCELTSSITRAVTENLLPARRARISARTVKSASSRYCWRPADEDRPRVSTPVIALDLTIHPPAADAVPASATGRRTAEPAGHNTPAGTGLGPAVPLPCPAASPGAPHALDLLPPPVPNHTSRLEDVLALMNTAPDRVWRAQEMALLLRLDGKNLAAGLSQWAKRGILLKTGPGAYQIPDGPPVPSKLAARLDDVLAVMRTDPNRRWHPRDVADAMNTVKAATLAIHLSAWTRQGLLIKTGPAAYMLPSAHSDEREVRQKQGNDLSKGQQMARQYSRQRHQFTQAA